MLSNKLYEGFRVDLHGFIAQKTGFKNEINLVPDGGYGAPDNWSMG